MIDFKQRASVTLNGQPIYSKEPFLQPDLRTLLEDVRTRADRQHPFWLRLDSPAGPRGENNLFYRAGFRLLRLQFGLLVRVAFRIGLRSRRMIRRGRGLDCRRLCLGRRFRSRL